MSHVECCASQSTCGVLIKPNADSYSLKSVKDWQTEQSEVIEHGIEAPTETPIDTPVGESSEKPAVVKTYTVVKGDSLVYSGLLRKH